MINQAVRIFNLIEGLTLVPFLSTALASTFLRRLLGLRGLVKLPLSEVGGLLLLRPLLSSFNLFFVLLGFFLRPS